METTTHKENDDTDGLAEESQRENKNGTKQKNAA